MQSLYQFVQKDVKPDDYLQFLHWALSSIVPVMTVGGWDDMSFCHCMTCGHIRRFFYRIPVRGFSLLVSCCVGRPAFFIIHVYLAMCHTFVAMAIKKRKHN